ncbi:MAG: SRPBCC family protein [Sphingorhabdus sp.]|jgi:hypothetical protein|uniref:SRPBCC family protein n=1 Tax=Sphingorhabdus sp. TaxID=1902408 RepID=UPI0025F3BB3C|nr:SRPBCC family protein [Sphingorhabdus sp.]MCO4091832.1 SRPBCC family protein [Sphingorhabdus sp.]
MIRKVLLALLVTAALAAGGLYGWGLSLPGTTRAQRDAVFPVPPAEVHARISDINAQADWRSDIGKVEVSADSSRWTEFAHDGSTISFRRLDSRPGELFAIGYISSRGFEGTWRVTLAPAAAGTRAQFVEEVTIASPFNRAIGKLVSPPGHHLDVYLADLTRVLGK